MLNQQSNSVNAIPRNKIVLWSENNCRKCESAYNLMRMCLAKVKVEDFPTEWDENIRNLLPRDDRIKHKKSINLMLKEVEDNYKEEMKSFTANIVFASSVEKQDSIGEKKESWFNIGPEIQRNDGRTNRDVFLTRRSSFRKKYFLYLDAVKAIMTLAELKLPRVICNFERYHQLGMLKQKDLETMIFNDIRKGSLAVSSRFYVEASKAIARTRILKKQTSKRFSNAMKCITNVFVQQVTNVMIRSIDHIIDTMEKGQFCPRLQLQLLFEDRRLYIIPSVEEISSMYHSLIDSITEIAQDLIPFEEWLDVKATEKYIKINLPKWYIEESHEKLQIILNKLLEPIKNDFEDISQEFQPICDTGRQMRILSLSSDNTRFDLCLQHLHLYNSYLTKAGSLVANRYYNIGKLEQSEAKRCLKERAVSVTNTFTSQLIMYHQEYNKKICEEFEELKERALNVPHDARSLIKLTEYVSKASRTLVKELESKIKESIRMLSALLDITVLTEDHINLNRETINWLSNIEPVFAQNNTLSEAMKSELEDDMQRTINILGSMVDEIVPQLSILDDMNDIKRVKEYVEYYKTFLKQVNRMDHEMQTINEEERLFRFPETEFPKVMELKEIIMPFYSLIHTIYQWQRDNAVWLDGPFEWLDASIIEKKTLQYLNEITEMSKTFKSRIKMDVTSNKCFKFSGIADDPDPMQQPTPLKLCWQVINDINEFKTYLPLATCMCNPALQERHWKEMSAICNFDLTPNAGTTLRKIIEFDLMNDIEKYEAISISANRELTLQQELSQMANEWEEISFATIEEEESGARNLENLSEIEILLAEHLVKIEEMRASNFVKPIEPEVTTFLHSLLRMREVIDYWESIQTRQLSFDSIFSYFAIEIALPEERSVYLEVQKDLVKFHDRISNAPYFQYFNDPANLESLRAASESLEYVDKGVKNYMQSKRISFPRFFFLTDKEIQRILFESNEMKELHVFLKKCFSGLEELRISKRREIISIFGSYGEELRLSRIIPIEGIINQEEQWLLELEREIIHVVLRNILQCYDSMRETSILNTIANFPSTAVICAQQISWTLEIHDCFARDNSTSFQLLYTKYNSYLTLLTGQIRNPAPPRRRILISSLIVVVLRQQEITKLLINRKVSKSTDFDWVAQLRYYVENTSVQVSMFNASIQFGCEYSYHEQCIVNTALTDRCFHSLMQAYKYHLYGAVTGPTATGKNETIRSLVKVLGVQFYSFNCHETVTYPFIIQLLKGFISCGPWICLENLHNLKTEVLSAIAENFVQITQAVSANLNTIFFEESLLTLNPTGHICTIMNLGQNGYSNLPDNLRVLFRTISMTIPDIKKIVEIELFSAGFKNSAELAVKLVTIRELLYKQLFCETRNNYHTYSIQTIIKTAICLKQNFPDENEHMLLLRSIIDTTISKLSTTDVLTFRTIVHDMFPNVELLPPNYSELLEGLSKICKDRCIEMHDTLKLKIIQVFEMLYIRQALILVGESYTGKSTILSMLAELIPTLHNSEDELDIPIQMEIINPEVATSAQLYGHFNKNSGIWIDGIFPKTLRCFTNKYLTSQKWIVFDGVLRDSWMEALYTVLDVNKTFYLSSGEKIDIPDNLSLIFETANLFEASPATLSRCGIVYIESISIDWRPYVSTRILQHNFYPDSNESVYALFDWAIDPCLKFLENNCKLICATGKLHIVVSTLNLFEMYLKDALDESTDEKSKGSHFLVWAQVALIQSISWGFGGNLDNESNTKFNTFCMTLWSGKNNTFPKPAVVKHFDVTLPTDGSIQDNFYIFKGVGNWKNWNDLLKSEKSVDIPEFNRVFVPTTISLKYTNLLLKHVKHRVPFIILGEKSCGKTIIVHDALKNKLSQENYMCNILNLVASNTLEKMQRFLLSRLYKKQRRQYGPPKDLFCITFIDDLNMEYENSISQINHVLSLLRQYMNQGHLYDLNEPEKIIIRDVMFSLAITVHGKCEIDPRFLRHYNVCTIYTSTSDAIFRVFSNTLLSNLKRNLFAADVLSSVMSITNATIDVYNAIIETLRPIPSKFQYSFNIRDVSRVITGCSLLQKESVETKLTFIRLWVHETWRVFSDRILDTTDKSWLFEKIRSTAKSNFKDSFETAFDYLPKFENNQLTVESFNYLMFGNFMDTERSLSRKYEEVNSIDTLKNKLVSQIAEYNNKNHREIDIVLTRYALESLVKVARILATPSGNLLMIAGPASGRRTITTLAAYTQQQKLFEPSVYAYRDNCEWRNCLKAALIESGGYKRDATLFLPNKETNDTHLREISSLLATGEIPELFLAEDRQNIIDLVRLDAQGGNRNAELKIRSVMDYFSERCKNKLHIVICFTPTSDAFKSCLQEHPTLMKYCTINWHDAWPETALEEIASAHMQDLKIQEDLKLATVQLSVKFYGSTRDICEKYHRDTGRITHVAPSAFLHMLKLYIRLMSTKQEEIVLTRNRYLAGLEKLELAAKQVEQMKATLTILKPQLEQSAQQTVITMKEVENENESVEKATIIVKQEEEVANKKTEIAATLRTECEAELAVAIPILEDAVAALNTLKPTDITLVKAMKNPPDTVKLVMAAVCVMLEVSADKSVDAVTGKKHTDYWSPSKRILGDMNFLQNLKEYDKDNIPTSVMQTIKKTYMTDNSFMPHIVAKASSAAEGLCKWVRAIVSYDDIAKVVAPKKEKLNAAQRECDEAEAFLNEKRRTLAALNAKLAILNNSLQETLQRKLKLELEVENCTSKLKTAENLIASLGGEKSRWMQSADSLKENYDNLIGDMILSSAMVTYMSPYSITVRDEVLKLWHSYLNELCVPSTKEYDFIKILGSESKINQWYFCGLAKNRFSTQNAIIMDHSNFWCLFIDSQTQANEWIKMIERKNDLEVVKVSDLDYMTVIEKSVEFGKPVLIENIGETLEVLLDPLLLKEVYRDNGIMYLNTGKKNIKYSNNFRIYITTRLENPHYSCEVFSKVTVVDFSIPNKALRNRLLDIVISKEKPELQETFENLLVQDARNKKILRQQEENILSTLSSTTTNILEDENAIQTLDASKNLSLEVIKKQEAIKLMAEEINEFRDSYIQFAKYSAGLFSTLSALCRLNHMYRFSFSWFIQLYSRSIDTSNRSSVFEKRLEFLKTSFIQNLHLSVSRSLSERHKILYSFLLCSKILLDVGDATEDEIRFLLSSDFDGTIADLESPKDWLPLDTWIKIKRLSDTFSIFRELADEFIDENSKWENCYNLERLQDNWIPEPWLTKLSLFQNLILVKTLRPDKVFLRILKLIDNTIGSIPNYPPQHKLSQSYSESNCFTPLIFILPSSFCPLSLLSAFAITKGFSSKFTSVSMSEGQEEKAEMLIKNGKSKGGWIFLHNCHLVPRWMVQLEKICENSDNKKVALDFRLWISTYAFNEFPISILQNSIKIAHDCPLNFKEHLLDIYQSEPVAKKEFFEGCPGKDKVFSKLLFGLCFFHIIVTERRYFGIQGWNASYNFNYSDLHISLMQLRDIVNENESVSLNTLLHLIGNCNYAGKMIDNIDSESLKSLFKYYCNSSVIKDCQYTFSSEFESLIPQRCEYLHVLKHIENITMNLSPEVFGSNENGVITRDTNITMEFLSIISNMHQIPLALNANAVYEKVANIVNDSIEKLPDTIEIDDRSKYSLKEPLNRVLIYEVDTVNYILRRISDTLRKLKFAFDGEIVLSDNLRILVEELYCYRVPIEWKRLQNTVTSNQLSVYFDNLRIRMQFIKNWMEIGCPKEFPFNVISSHQLLLSSLLLTYAKERNVPIEKVEFKFRVRTENTISINNSYAISGLYLCAGRWDTTNNRLENNPVNAFWQKMPPIDIEYSNTDKSIKGKYYKCPIYVAPVDYHTLNEEESRNNYIMNIPLNTDVNPARWIKCKTSLYCHIEQI